jgi:beta-mannosidase
MKSAYQPRTITIGRVDQGAQLTVINDTLESWESSAHVSLVDSAGNIVDSTKVDFKLDAFGVFRSALVEIFPQIASLNFEGFLHVDAGEVRAARRTTLNPAKTAPVQNLTSSVVNSDGALEVTVLANSYIHELSLLSEVIDLGTQVDTQLVSLLPGQSHTFIVSAEPAVLRQIEDRLSEILWSHNRVVAG